MAAVTLALRDDVARRLERATAAFERFLRRGDVQRTPDEPTLSLGRILCQQARQLRDGALNVSVIGVTESTLRSGYRLSGALSNLAAWTAPASHESAAVNSFPVPAPRDAVSYARYGCPETAEQEMHHAAMLGMSPDRARLLLTSSGMAACTLLECFLLREVLRRGDRILMHSGTYFEVRQQMQSLPFVSVRLAPSGSRSQLLDSIARIEPRVVFVDPLTNSADCRAIDVPRLLDEAEALCRRETWFVIDGTLLSGGFNPFARQRRNIRVLYYESGCKYLQFGLDLGPAGVVVVDRERADVFERLRRGTGTIGTELLVLPRTSRDVYLEYLRLQTAAARAAAESATEVLGRVEPVMRVVCPGTEMHTDFSEGRGYPHFGGILTFCFVREAMNRRAPLEAFIELLLQTARAAGVPLTSGVSFGFRVARVSAAWSSFDAECAFLRLSAGADVAAARQVGRLIACAALRTVKHEDLERGVA